MSLKKGFESKLYLVVGSATTELPTIGDLSYGIQRTNIQVKTRASETIRVLPGMKSVPLTVEVIDGVDPEDPTQTNSFALLKAAFDSKTPVHLKIGTLTDPEVDEVFSILGFDHAAPVDGLKTASVTMEPSALSEGSGT